LSVKREIKCQHCGQYTLWLGNDYDRCLYCNEFLQNHEFILKLENDIVTQVKEENDLFHINPEDSRLKRFSKRFFRKLRKVVVITQGLFIAFMIFLLWIIGLLTT
jgi:hypothetical protein